MKNTLLSLLAVMAISFNAVAQTNVINLDTNAVAQTEGKSFGSVEVTFGGGGTTINGETEGGFDFSISTNPLDFRPEVWVGLAQSIYWEPSFAASTDIFVDWSWNLYKETLYLNTGWSVGAVYDNKGNHNWRNGPEATLQYYVGDNAFIYSGLNWDFVKNGDDGFRYSFGVGLTF